MFHQLVAWFDLATFSGAFGWVIAHGYPLMFLAMLVEGPVVTAAASFAAAFGYFSVFIVLILSILGDVMADVIYYAVGYWGRIVVFQKFGRRFGLTEERIRKIEGLLNSHPTKTLIALKLTPILPTPGLMIAGTSRMPLKKFITICSFVILPKTIFFVVLGYYFGSAYSTVLRKFEKGELILGIIIGLILAIYYAFTKLSSYVGRKVEKI
jgi:membrane protein DedA with SNARE-associated domain